MKKKIIFGILAALMIFLPLHSVRAAEKIDYSFENSALLMISNHMRLNGDVESANVGNGHLLSVPIKQFARQDKNEFDILIQLYANQIAGLRQSGNHSPELEEQLINSLEEKVDVLKERADKLDEARRSRRRGGLFGFVRRIAKAVGRGTGWIMGKTMEGAGKVVQFGIEEVAPKVLEKVVVGGNPLGAALFRTVARDLLIKRVEVAIIREVEKRAERGQVVLSDEENEEIDELVDSMETQSAIEESEENQAALKEDDNCDPSVPWMSVEYWENEVVPLLVSAGKGCSSIYPYQTCLMEKAAEGLCEVDAFAACETIYESLIPTRSGQSVHIIDDEVYFRDSDNHFDITIPLSGGPVSGSIFVEYLEDKGGGDYCQVTITYTFTGTYNPNTCILNGSGVKTLAWEESRSYICVGYPEPYDDQRTNWAMKITNGVLNTGAPEPGINISETYGIQNYLK